MTVAITLKVINRPNKKLFLVTNFFNLFFAIIYHKKSRLFDKIRPIFENTYYKNQTLSEPERVSLLRVNNHFIMLPHSNTLYNFILQKLKTQYLYLILTSFFHCVIRKYLGSVLKPLILC